MRAFDFFVVNRAFYWKNGVLSWNILVGNQKQNVQKPIAHMLNILRHPQESAPAWLQTSDRDHVVVMFVGKCSGMILLRVCERHRTLNFNF